MEISICVPSYRRAGKVKTLTEYPKAKMYVSESEADGYRDSHPGATITVMPDSVQGNVARVRNYILDSEFEAGADGVVMLDDDVSYVGMFDVEQREWGLFGYAERKLDEGQLAEFVERGFLLCSEWGFKMWGLNPNQTDRMAYKHNTPFNTKAFCGGPFQAFLPNPIRYDERLYLKEDYDMTLQHIREYDGCLRFNAYHIVCNQADYGGGCALSRNVKAEKEQMELLVRKWGSRVVQQDESRRGYDFNPKLKIPVNGV